MGSQITGGVVWGHYSGDKIVDNAALTLNTWTDLDLSSIIGVGRRLVILQIIDRGTTTRNIAFRRNGDTTDGYSSGGYATNRAYIGSLGSGEVVCTTDASGIVEYKSSDSSNVDIVVESYVVIY